jgi:hypothetical protein
MARYKRIDTSPRFLAVDLERQLLSGSFAHADGQWKLYCLVHNIEKLAHHGYGQ